MIMLVTIWDWLKMTDVQLLEYSARNMIIVRGCINAWMTHCTHHCAQEQMFWPTGLDQSLNSSATLLHPCSSSSSLNPLRNTYEWTWSPLRPQLDGCISPSCDRDHYELGTYIYINTWRAEMNYYNYSCVAKWGPKHENISDEERLF